MRGKFITFEGCEGVGKSAQVRMLGAWLSERGASFTVTREPGGSGICEAIRKVILDPAFSDMDDSCELLLYLAARAQHLKDVIIPALAEGKLVVCDRYMDSTLAYQGFAKGMGVERVRRLNALTAGDYIPDLTVFLDYPPDKAFMRKGGADKSDRLENLDKSFHMRVYEGYKLLAEEEPQRIVSVDASGTKFETHAKIIELLSERGFIVG